MYGPAPIRPRKSDFARSRAGCMACRTRRRKCDELKPCCLRCEVAGRVCEYSAQTIEFRDASLWAAHKVKKVRGDRLKLPSEALSLDSVANGPWTGSNASAIVPPISRGTSRKHKDNNDLTRIFHATNFLTFPRSLTFPGLAHQDMKYLAHFANHAANNLPPSFGDLLRGTFGSEVIFSAAMALGAANLANLQGRLTSDAKIPAKTVWDPDIHHKLNSLKYAGNALSLTRSQPSGPMSIIVISHLLLSFVETELGTFGGLRRYVATISNLILSTWRDVFSNECEVQILRSVIEVRSMLGFSAGPWDTPTRPQSTEDRFWEDLELSIPSVSGRIYKSGSRGLTAGACISILQIMKTNLERPHKFRNYIINEKAALLLPDSESPNLKTISEVNSALKQYLQDFSVFSNLTRKLQPPEGIPYLTRDAEGNCNILVPDEYLLRGTQDIPPLRFPTHHHTMTVADYCFSRIMSEQGPVLDIVEKRPARRFPEGRQPMNPWVYLLLQVVRGLDITECSRRNIYRRGVPVMLLETAIRCSEPRILAFLKDYLIRIGVVTTGRDDSLCPTADMQRLSDLIHQHLQKGRSVIALASVKGTFSETTAVLSNQIAQEYVIHGIEACGQYFDEHVALGVARC
ncbi:hypothetical protein BX600DRAFT_467520 [Xylariales sp. PMI_506]|nr:hypothetical protein BX600DRAFT_467520 [Xylariales sp. PMI_506]